MDMRLLEVGCCRHPQQLDTPADGCCGVWATGVQLISSLTVATKQRLREEVVDTLPVALERGVVNWDGQGCVQSPQAWMDHMRQKSVFVDHIWLQLAAAHFQRDFILLPVFPDRWLSSGSVCRLFGRLRDTPASGPPVLLMVAESLQFISPHYQVLMDYHNVFILTHFVQAVSIIDQRGLEMLEQLQPLLPPSALSHFRGLVASPRHSSGAQVTLLLLLNVAPLTPSVYASKCCARSS